MNVFYRPIASLINYYGQKKELKTFSESPIYMGGCGRSGTTLLLSILSSHPEIFAVPSELDMYKKIRFESRDVFGPLRIDRFYKYLLEQDVDPRCKRWCEKTPRNIRNINAINCFHNGNYRFINIVRDGRDVILSKHPKLENNYWVEPERWIRDVSAGLAEIHNPRVLTIRYEDLVLSFEPEIEKICSFLNVPVTDEIINWHKHATVRENKAYFGSVEDIFSSSIGKWKKDENYDRAMKLQNIEEGAKLLEHYGYALG